MAWLRLIIAEGVTVKTMALRVWIGFEDLAWRVHEDATGGIQLAK
jgi:hypothetical protein